MKRMAAIGMFDGVHSGHRAMLSDLCRQAREHGMEPMVVTFTSHPLSVVDASRAPGMLMSAGRRRELLSEVCGGKDGVLMLDFTPELRRLKAADFMRFLRDEYNVGAVYLGFNHRFGSDRLREFADYSREAAALGLEALQGIEERGSDGCRISSSEIRQTLSEGNVEQARRMLGRPYRLEGTVVGGRQLGRTIGFPTANLNPTDSQMLVPATGVYAAIATMADGRRWPAVVNIGHRPTVGEFATATIEAHLIGFSGDLYGSPLTLDFYSRLRDEQRFESMEALRQQIERDRERAKELLPCD